MRRGCCRRSRSGRGGLCPPAGILRRRSRPALSSCSESTAVSPAQPAISPEESVELPRTERRDEIARGIPGAPSAPANPRSFRVPEARTPFLRKINKWAPNGSGTGKPNRLEKQIKKINQPDRATQLSGLKNKHLRKRRKKAKEGVSYSQLL